MKRLLSFVFLLASACVAFAASPSFDSFNTNQFSTISNRVAIKDGVALTNPVPFGTITSTVSDGASAVAFKVNSSNTLANAGAIIVAIQNNGTNVVTVDSFGGGFNGRYAEDFWGGPSGGYYAYVRTDGEGGIDYQWIGIDEDDFLIQNFIVLRLNSSTAQFSVSDKAVLFPTRGATAVPYLFDTTLTHTSGNLLEVKNNGTNKFVVPFDGAVTINGAVAATYAGITNVMTWALSDMTTALTTGTNKNYWYAPAAGMTIKFVRATLATSSSSGTPTFDINEAGTSILSTKITIDANEWDSFTAATPPVISDSAIAANAKVDFDIDVAGTAAAGAQIQVGFTVP